MKAKLDTYPIAYVDGLAARVAELEARCRRMEEIGDMIVDEYMVEKAEKDAWQQAKEAKP